MTSFANILAPADSFLMCAIRRRLQALNDLFYAFKVTLYAVIPVGSVIRCRTRCAHRTFRKLPSIDLRKPVSGYTAPCPRIQLILPYPSSPVKAGAGLHSESASFRASFLQGCLRCVRGGEISKSSSFLQHGKYDPTLRPVPWNSGRILPNADTSEHGG